VNFEFVLSKLIEEFDRLRLRYAVIGGFALGVLGTPRLTMDVDFLIHRDDLNELHITLTALGYQRVFYTENVSQYQHEDAVWGSVDFIHAFRSISLAMLERAKKFPVFGGKRTLATLAPEDVIGLKVQARANDPQRAAKERHDIDTLAQHYGAKLDWDRIEEYYLAFGWIAEAKQLRERYDRAN
jgi:hypothetical protein